jgi:hypothetical protein
MAAVSRCARPRVFVAGGACLRSGLCYLCRVAGYRRPLSRGELQQIRRQKMRLGFFCGLGIVFGLAAVSGVIYLMYAFALP